MTEDRDIAEKTSTVMPVRAEMTDANVVYRYQCEPVRGLVTAACASKEPEAMAPLNLLAATSWASN